MQTTKYICIHGHFYQPPRENAWLEVIEQQESAAPFHDWNERINFECYATNAVARILDEKNKIVKIVNNYSRISFNLGATLLSWMEHADPDTYRLIQEADRESVKLFSGHGSAVAQVFSHAIMPLANYQDKVTQVVWGIRDFEYRFSRKPEGMWLAETAVDTETLEVLADYGIKYTILAPRQAKASRKITDNTEGGNWQQVEHENIDTRRPYLVKLPSGKSISVFFYNGNASQAVAFERLLNSGKAFANRLLSGFDGSEAPQLVNIATDGESYGHHHRLGEMALADCLNFIEEKSFACLTNYGEFLAKYPPQYEAQIHERSSWSCVHGVERWQSDCGCNTGGPNAGHQRWRGPLRFALNWLRDQLIPVYEELAGQYVNDPWKVRNEYISVLLNRSENNIDAFLDHWASRKLTKNERVHLFRLLEMQRNAILMFTSCGWFFDDISGIENAQILQYACRAVHYAKQVADLDLEEEFKYRLSQAPSNLPEYANGLGVYERSVKPAAVDLTRVAMHYAASSLFETYPNEIEFFNYIAKSEVLERIEAGNQILSVGRTVVRSKITHSEKPFSFAVLYLGQLSIVGGISLDMDKAVFDNLYKQIKASFDRVDLAEVIRLIVESFKDEKFDIWELFKEQKQKIINQITEKNLKGVEDSFRKIYTDNYQLMSGLKASGVQVPEAYRDAAQYVLNTNLKNFFMSEALEINDLKRTLDAFQKWNISFSDEKAFQLAASERIYHELLAAKTHTIPLSKLQSLNGILTILKEMKVELSVWKTQTIYFDLKQAYDSRERAYPSPEWRWNFRHLGNLLNVKTEHEVLETA
jgi:alpha-amylase/alpha-mannosidase (GH57 family)